MLVADLNKREGVPR